MKSDRLGLVLVAISLLVMAMVGGFAHQYRNMLHQEKVRTLGLDLSRVLSATEFDRFADDVKGKALLARMLLAQPNPDLAYAVVVNSNSSVRYGVGPVRTAPTAALPTEPHAWFGEQVYSLPILARDVLEFRAPLMQDGELGGFVRIAFFDTPTGGWVAEAPTLATLLLPVALLMAVSYYLGRRELRALKRQSWKISEVARTIRPGEPLLVQGGNVADFMRQIEQFIELAQGWIQQTQGTSVAAQTATHLLTYKQEKAESVLHAMPDAILLVDEECVPTFANARAEHVLNTKLDALIGRPALEWCHNAELLAFLMRFKNAPAALGQASLSFAPEAYPERRFSVVVLPLFLPRDNATLFGRLVLLRDITSEHLARQAGTEFVTHVAHELKTPLNTLAVYSELLQDYAALDEAERINAVNVIHAEAARMANLINNLLNISKLEAGTLQIARKRVKIHDLLQDAFESMRPVAAEQQVSLQLKIPPDLGSARLDKELLRIAIDNLLSNGVKYSAPGTTVTLAAELLDNNEIQISVRDQGIGISREDCAHVFEKYFRADTSETLARSGHGLGLFLARQIVELHQGSVTVDSEPGKGSVFTIALRAQPMHLEESRL